MRFTGRQVFVGTLLFVLIVAVSASVTEKLLHIPLFEVGEIWVNSVVKIHSRIFNYAASFVDLSSYTFYVIAAAGIVGLYYLFRLLFEPINRIRLLGDVGYLAEGRLSKKDIANAVSKRRLVGEVPPVYPNGWFGLIESWALKKGESKNISALGLNLAVFRDEKGEAHILDAYCPHMGANLAAGGRVVGDCIECPFHGWKFRGHDGKCTSIPYSENIPDIAKVKSWPCLEVNGWVYLWFHAEEADPTWTPPELEGIESGNWVYRGRTEHHINAHIEEVPENGADVAHLLQVHTPFMLSGIDLNTMWNKLYSFAFHAWSAQWTQQTKPDEHIGAILLTHKMMVFGKCLSPVNLDLHIRQIGPGIVYLEFESFFGKGVFVQSLLPTEPLVQKLVHNIYMHWTVPNIIAKFFMYGEAIQVERDLMIWNNKKYQIRPVFVKSKEDSLIARHRRWFAQFYTENSPRLGFKKESLEW